MKKLLYIATALILSTGFYACDNVDFGDTNQNVNGSEDPSPSGLLSGAIMDYATYTGRTGVTIPTLYVQYQSQVTYTDEMQYAESPYSWDTYYDILSALTQVIETNADEANHTPDLILQGAPENQQGVAMILRAIVMKRLTDVYGPVAFSEAFQGLSDFTPVYDDQESIYKSLIDQLKAGRDMINTGAGAPTGDILYDGSLPSWQKLANSVLLQMTIQLSNVYPDPSGYAATEFQAALDNEDGLIESLATEAWFQYQDITGFKNPWFANRTSDYFLSKEFTDAMTGADPTSSLNPTSSEIFDNRIKVYEKWSTDSLAAVPNGMATDSTQYALISGEGVPYGYGDGDGEGKVQMSTQFYWNATSSLPLMTASYTYLNRAEAAALGWTSEVANEMLTMGIEMSFNSLEDKSMTEATSAKYVANISDDGERYAMERLDDIDDVDGGVLQIIGEEKWKALFGQAFDAWAEWRRTGYPDLKPATDFLNTGEIPTRFLYPTDEAALNNANYMDGVSKLIPAEDHNTSLVWWDAE